MKPVRAQITETAAADPADMAVVMVAVVVVGKIVEGTNSFTLSILPGQREKVSITVIKVNSSLSFYTQGRSLFFSGCTGMQPGNFIRSFNGVR
jgi:hypothetical protein